MGGTSWSAAEYGNVTQAKINSGQAFSYANTARQTGNYTPHDLLSPKWKNKAGQQIREVRDSDKDLSVPIAITLDGTGSLGSIPRDVQKKLNGLFGLLVRKGYIADGLPHLAISMYGDAKTDKLPLQFGNFESSNAFDDTLDKLIHEGNGGGNGGESQSLVWYFINNHIFTDAWEKRGKKGYYFVVADEITHQLQADEVKRIIGDGEPLSSLKTADLARDLQEKWNVIVLLIDNLQAKTQKSEQFYKDLFGEQSVITIENPDTITETIGAVIGLMENEDLTSDELEDDLIDVGADKAIAGATVNAVARLANGRNRTVTKADGTVDLDI